MYMYIHIHIHIHIHVYIYVFKFKMLERCFAVSKLNHHTVGFFPSSSAPDADGSRISAVLAAAALVAR